MIFLFRQEEINTQDQDEKKVPAKPWKKAMTKTRVINNLTGVVSKLTFEKRDSLDIQRSKNVSYIRQIKCIYGRSLSVIIFLETYILCRSLRILMIQSLQL